MWLENIDIQHFRNYTEASVSFSPHLNIFLGRNAQGKTNILEAIYFLALTRSHRTRSDKELIQFQQNTLKLNGIVHRHSGKLPLEISLSNKGRITKVNHLKQAKLSDYIGHMTVVLFAPEDLQLVKGSPSLRRKFIDIDLGQIKPVYLSDLSSYNHVLKQRNAYLKSTDNVDINFLSVLDEQLSDFGTRVIEHRLEFIKQLEEEADRHHSNLSNQIERLKISYESNIPLENNKVIRESFLTTLTSIIISHKLNEISYVADKITVIRDGSTIETLVKGKDDITESRIIKGMVGREIADRFPKREPKIGEVLMEVKNWTVHHPLYSDRKVVDNVNLNVKKGEVVGISGLMGAGRTELAMSLFGKSYGSNISGELYINGKKVQLNTVQEAIKNHLAYVTEDRKGNGLILSNPIKINTTLANLDAISRHTVIDKDKEYNVAVDYKNKLNTKCPTVEQNVGNLSGGNQQKVLLAKWMFTDPDILILDEPTRGIDVGAKYEIYCIINQLVAEGKSVIMISSELPEILGMCDRIYVMNEGKIVGELAGSEATQELIMSKILSAGKKGALA